MFDKWVGACNPVNEVDMAGLKDIAEKCSVSLATASRVLNHDESLSVTKEVRDSIVAEAERQGYLPPRQRRLREKSYTIAFASKNVFKPGYESTFLERLDRVGQSFSMRFVSAGTILHADGVILLGDFPDEGISSFRALSPHLLVINNQKKDYSYDRIVMDYDDAERQVVDFFLSRGCRDIGYYGGIHQEAGVTIGKKRQQYLVRLLEEKGLYRDENIRIGGMDALSGYETTMSAKHIPQAILFGDCAFATGAFRALEERGEKPLTVVYQDLDEYKGKDADAVLRIFSDTVWRNACRFLMQRIRGERDTAFAVLVPAKLEILDKNRSEK